MQDAGLKFRPHRHFFAASKLVCRPSEAFSQKLRIYAVSSDSQSIPLNGQMNQHFCVPGEGVVHIPAGRSWISDAGIRNARWMTRCGFLHMYLLQLLRTVLNPSMPFITKIMGAPRADSASTIFASGHKVMRSNAEWTMYDRIFCPLNSSGKEFLLNLTLICLANCPHLSSQRTDSFKMGGWLEEYSQGARNVYNSLDWV